MTLLVPLPPRIAPASGPASAQAPVQAPAQAVAQAAVGPARISVVILTQATRPAELERAIASVRAQQGVGFELVLVMNGAPAPAAAIADRTDRLIVLAENVGIPAGRNIGAAAASAELVLFLDDDAELLQSDLLLEVTERFAADRRLGAMAVRLVDADGRTQRRHVPRIGGGTAAVSGPVTHFVGAACVVRSGPFTRIGGFDPRFFYAMEESEFSWRLLDAGWRIHYAADLFAYHPRTSPSRHSDHVRLTARNRYWMAWRSLPNPLLAVYLGVWTLLAVLRGAPVRHVATGYREARAALPDRRPMRWATVARMTAIGRPPVV